MGDVYGQYVTGLAVVIYEKAVCEVCLAMVVAICKGKLRKQVYFNIYFDML